jgi:asparagine synthase (glutamine-hydrolysing)
MCGINGFSFPSKELAFRMKEFTKNRGPNADGVYLGKNITLTHNRLSIIDLNERANQPMEFKNLVITYNGEIYNFKDLKFELENLGYFFKTNSDTEVILYLFHKFNVEGFKKLSGIFAIAIWDNDSKALYLIRDTVGVKPIYYYKNFNNEIFFSSSIKSLLISVDKKILNEKSLNYYSNFGRNDSDETMFKGIYKLKPGNLLIYKNKEIIIKKFLDFKFEKKIYSNQEIKSEIEKTIQNQFISDVPVALSLSGGVDSNIVYSVMRNKLKKKFNIYSFYFHDYDKFNEDFYTAKSNAKYFDDNFIPIEIKHNQFIENAEDVTKILEEPLANQCSILNYVMSKKVKEKVLFTGDGGDETFTGYDKYRSILIINTLQKLNFFKNLKIKTKNKNLKRLFIHNAKDLYLSFSEKNIFKDLDKYFINYKEITAEELEQNHTTDEALKNNLNSICYLDLDTVVPNDYLLRNDKIFMNEAIEVRVPLLDVNIINKFLMMNQYRKFNYSLESKGLLKKIFKNDIHKLTKKKLGLQSPYAKWMKQPLQKFLKEILSKEYYNNSNNYLNFNEINKMIQKHQDEYYNPHLLWGLVMLQIFLKKFKM